MTSGGQPGPLLVAMGVSGSGKTTIGSMLAARVGCEFVDADELHPARNVAKMSAGIPLDDEDRWPWLAAVGARLAAAKRADSGLVVACSALRRTYRDAIRDVEPSTRFVHLSGDRALLLSRLGARKDHFMPSSLLDTQLAELEPLGADESGLTVSIDHDESTIVTTILSRLSV